MTAVVATLVGVLLAVLVLVVVETISQSRLARHLATGVGAVCLVLFVLINVSDWPGGFLNQFWLDHAIVGATAGTLLLASSVFLVYRYRDQQKQDLIDESITDAARSELVDRLVDVDVALSLLSQPTKPEWCDDSRLRSSQHGLEWLREHFDESGAVDGYWAERDPRLWAHATRVDQDEWRLRLLDQMSRRIAGGVRDWGPILLESRQGQQDLVAFANVRVVLLQLDRELRRATKLDTRVVEELQHVVRRFAHLLEVDEQTPEPRKKLSVPGDARPGSVVELEDKAVASVIGQINSHVDRRTRPVKQRASAGSLPPGSTPERPRAAESESLVPPR